MEKKRCRDDEDLLLLPKGDLIEIMLRLPVTSLLRFKSVCKSWRALIESSFFIDLHTTTTFNSSSSSKFGSFILHAGVNKHSFKLDSFILPPGVDNYPSLSTENRLLMLSSGLSESESESESGGLSDQWDRLSRHAEEDDQPDYDYDYDDDDDEEVVFKVGVEEVFKVEEEKDNLGSKLLVLKLDNFGFPSCYEVSRRTRMVGSCNGLVCLYEEDRNQVSFWNPATRQFRILPKPITIDGACPRYNHLVAFGFDVETKDYKVVLFTGFKTVWYKPIAPIECPCRVQVYSLSSDSWRLLEDITYLPGDPFFSCSHHQVLYLNGSCFFLAHFLHSRQLKCVPENDRFIISFDFTKEIITPMMLPDHHKNQELYLSYFGDKIALFTVCYKPISPYDHANYYHTLCVDADYNIWVHDGGTSSFVKKGSWKKLHNSFRIKGKRPGKWNVPKGISNDGEFALLETEGGPGLGKKMKLYNLVTKEMKKDFLFCKRVVSKGANVYKPSLVSIIGGNGAASAAPADRMLRYQDQSEMAKQGSYSNWEDLSKRRNSNWEGMMKWWSGGGTRPTYSEERWLELVVDVADRVEQIAAVFYYQISQVNLMGTSIIPTARIQVLLNELLGYVESNSIDLANELHSIGRLGPFLYCLNNPVPDIRAKAAEVITAMVQNNPRSQQLVIEANGLQPLFYNFMSDLDATARTKALGAVSSLIRNNETGITEFRRVNGYEALRDALSSEGVGYQREALNLIQYLLHENSSDCDIVTEFGFPRIMMHLTSGDDAEVREAALRCLLVLARDEEGGNSGQLVKNDDKLKQVLQERIEGINAMAPEDLGAAREERQLVDSLWNACYNEPSSLR